MRENTIIVGIDISAATFTASIGGEVREFKNSSAGFGQLDRWAGPCAKHVMEASGPYFLGLALHLYEKGRQVSVVNPLAVRRYSQMKFIRAKTDRKDAMVIESYGREQSPPLWTPPSKEVDELMQLLSAINIAEKAKRKILNNLGANKANPRSMEEVSTTLQTMADHIATEIKRLWKMVRAIIQDHFREEDELLQSIPGIGPKTSASLLVKIMRAGMFKSAKQLQAFFGLTPRVFDSGTSVKGRGSIDKLGNSEARRMLYMSAITASRHNPVCKLTHDRLIAAGKKKKVVFCAVAAKLSRMVFAVLKYREPFRAIGNLVPVKLAS